MFHFFQIYISFSLKYTVLGRVVGFIEKSKSFTVFVMSLLTSKKHLIHLFFMYTTNERSIFLLYLFCENVLKNKQKSQNSKFAKYSLIIVYQYIFVSISYKNCFGRSLPFLPTKKLPDRYPSVSEVSTPLCLYRYCRASFFYFQ